MSGKQNHKIKTKHNCTLAAFFVLVIFAILDFFLTPEILFSAFAFLVILHFSSAQVPRDEKYKITKNGNAENKIASARKKFEIAKNTKTKNVLSTFSTISFSRHIV